MANPTANQLRELKNQKSELVKHKKVNKSFTIKCTLEESEKKKLYAWLALKEIRIGDLVSAFLRTQSTQAETAMKEVSRAQELKTKLEMLEGAEAIDEVFGTNSFE